MWNEYVERQKSYEVHEQTRSIVLLFAEVSSWPRWISPSSLAGRGSPTLAVPLMHEIIGKWYPPGGTIIRAMAARLFAGGRIVPHRDAHPSFARGPSHSCADHDQSARAVHDRWPAVPLEIGQCYEINNQKVHSVMNKGDTDRIHFIFDYVPPRGGPS